ncbi:alpha/beta-hydrolase [Thozetella sp. PMI_491]|nr:alpha/beta-hydrolase [Thozetella sp. PMI_491]
MAFPKLIQAFTCTILLVLISLASPAQSTKCTDSGLAFFATTDGTKYAYSFTPAQGENSTFLLLHGYPGSHKDWHYQIAALTAEGFGVLAPDMLGFGASDMPTDPWQYSAKRLAGHLVELLDHEAIDTVIGVGHDWGSSILSRLAVYHQNRFNKLVWISVGYLAPGGLLDLDAINSMAAAEYGYMPYGYWYFFTRYDASGVIGNHLESYWHLLFPENNTIWKAHFGPVGAARAWLNANTLTGDPSFLDAAYKADWLAWMSRPNAIDAGLNCYRSQYGGINEADEASLTDEDWKLHVPVLTIAGALDAVTRPGDMEATKAWAGAGFESKTLNGGHWLSQELPEDVNELLIEFGRAQAT